MVFRFSKVVAFWLAMGLVGLMVLAGWEEGAAEPFIALQTGFKCSACHIRTVGGGQRSEYGLIYAQTVLPASRPFSMFVPAFGTSLSVGMDTVMGKEGDAFGLSSSALYLRAPLAGDPLRDGSLEVLVTQSLSPSPMTDEFYLLYRGRGATLRLGKIMSPTGWHQPFHGAFVRRVTPEGDHPFGMGVELDWEPGPWTVTLAYTRLRGVGHAHEPAAESPHGLASSLHRRMAHEHEEGGGDTNVFVGSMTYTTPNWRAGFVIHRATGGLDRLGIGWFGGVRFGRFTLLGEIDWVRDGERHDQMRASWLELNAFLTQGLNLKFMVETLDLGGGEGPLLRTSLGLEVFPVPFTKALLMVRETRQKGWKGTSKDRKVIFQFRFFF